MQSLQHILLSNAAGAAVLGGAVWLLCRVARSPAVCRALWIIVLLKLVTPPLFAVPLHTWLDHQPPTAPTSKLTAPRVNAIETLPKIELPARSDPPATVPTPVAPTWRQRTLTLIPIVWAAGTLVFLSVGAIRVLMLVRLLAKAPPAPDAVQQLARSVAVRLGIAKPPHVCFVPGVVCPALWAFSASPRVIIPLTLWDRLDDPERRTLLAHELAHLRRGDHWVRLLEFVTAVVYWWHPAVWVGRRQIHDYEEQCCDAWVLWAMPASARTYGSALLEAVDFVSSARPMRPALSAGLGEFRHLKRRLLMIKQGTVSRALSRTSLAAVLGAAAVVLPFTPGSAQEAAPQALPGSVPSTSPETAPPVNPQIAEARARVQRLQRELGEARSRLAVLERGSAPAAGGSGAVSIAPGTVSAAPSSAYAGAGGIYAGEASVQLTPVPVAPGAGYARAGVGTSGTVDPRAAGALPRPGAAAGGMPPAGMPGMMGGGGYAGAPPRLEGGRIITRPAPADAEHRLEGLEDQLRQLMDQVRELREMQQSQRQNKP